MQLCSSRKTIRLCVYYRQRRSTSATAGHSSDDAGLWHWDNVKYVNMPRIKMCPKQRSSARHYNYIQMPRNDWRDESSRKQSVTAHSVRDILRQNVPQPTSGYKQYTRRDNIADNANERIDIVGALLARTRFRGVVCEVSWRLKFLPYQYMYPVLKSFEFVRGGIMIC